MKEVVENIIQYPAPTPQPEGAVVEFAHSYRPSGFYFRLRLREAATVEEAQEAGLRVCGEHERLRDWVRHEFGVVPPKWFIDPLEAEHKGWKAS